MHTEYKLPNINVNTQTKKEQTQSIREWQNILCVQYVVEHNMIDNYVTCILEHKIEYTKVHSTNIILHTA